MRADNWQWHRLGDFATLQRGIAYTSNQLTDGGRPFVNLKSFDRGGGFRPEGTKCLNGHLPDVYALHGGELLIANTDLTRDGSIIGSPAIAPSFPETPACFSMDVSRINVSSEVAQNKFLFYRMQQPDVRRFMQARSGGSTVLHLNIQAVTDLRLSLPPLPEQRRIAEILDTLDEAIRKTEQVIAKLQQMKQGLLHDLLTRGIDENGELRDPERHPEQFKESELGRIPRGWDIYLLDDVAFRGSGHTPAKNVPAYWNGGIKWVSLADSNKLDHIYISETDKSISNLGIDNSSAVKHPAGTVILSRDAGIGKSSVLACEMAVSQHFMAWRCGDMLNNIYLYYWLQHKKPRFEAIAMGSTIKTIGLAYFKSLKITVPTVREQQFVSESLLANEKLIAAEARELEKLRRQKQGLMDDLLTGRVRVPHS